ncbi:MAG: hypothetical protein FWH11_07885 [Micrococcales bacterium]|nr:hypothetical protein [Micrococcales bacterium]
MPPDFAGHESPAAGPPPRSAGTICSTPATACRLTIPAWTRAWLSTVKV